jgi:hypothetical protein
LTLKAIRAPIEPTNAKKDSNSNHVLYVQIAEQPKAIIDKIFFQLLQCEVSAQNYKNLRYESKKIKALRIF